MVASGVEEGIFTVDSADKSLLLATKHRGSCCLWKADLSDEAMLKHVSQFLPARGAFIVPWLI